jgi:two-component system OmpR family sensor kinase
VKPRWWFLPLLPLVVALVAVVPLTLWTPNPVFYLRANLATLVEVAAGLLAALIALALWAAERSRQGIAETRDALTDGRHHFMLRLDHELKNPVQALVTALDNLVTEDLTASQREIVSTLRWATRRLAYLTVGLRSLGGMDTGLPNRSLVNAEMLLREAVEVVSGQPYAAGRDIQWEVGKTPWPPPDFSGDHELLLVCVYNLLDNACKFSRPGDHIEARATAVADNSVIEISVADTGMGISEQDLPHLGEELYRAQDALGHPGSGLGLALVRTVVEQHGGQLLIQSRSTGGTSVIMRLPVQAPPDKPTSGKPADA